MDYFFAKLKYSIENEPVTTFFTILVIVLVILAVWLFRRRTKDGRTPDIFEYDGYYKITRTYTGFKVTDRLDMHTLTDFYFLRSKPFDIEVIIEDITADNGKKYHAHAVVTTVLPEEMVNNVCNRYFRETGSKADYHSMPGKMAAERKAGFYAGNIISDNAEKKEMTTDELFAMALSKNDEPSYSRKRNRNKTNCDAEIDMDLTIAFSAALKKLIEEKGGTATEEELKKVFLGLAMLSAMNYGHTVTAIPDFDVVEVTE